MPRRRGLPSEGEVVVAKIVKINPNSAFAQLVEYGVEGMIHISEVASGWVRDIRHFIKQDQEIVALVIRKEPLSLSIKRVNPRARDAKLKEYNLEKRAEKMLQLAAQKLGKTLEQGYEEAGFLLQERFGSMYAAFKEALSKPDKLEKVLPKEWVSAIAEVAEKSIEQKEFEFSAKLFLRSYEPNGISAIRELLKRAERAKLEVRYIAAPQYLVKYRTLDPKKGGKEFVEKLNKIVSEAGNIEAKFEIVE
ncbi:MAG: S1 RNA-binding domain-containing protein [Candidatus Aenigmatarchaeota archaeon]